MTKRPSGRHGKGTREPFIMIEKRLLESPAWKDLHSSSMITYFYLKKQKKNNNCGEYIVFPYENNPDNLFSSRTFSNSIKELVSHGFIEIENPGGLENNPSVYRLSDRWELWESNNTL